ncbi:MAG: hypothetical protein ABEJ26_10545 [Halosimplex sp.]
MVPALPPVAVGSPAGGAAEPLLEFVSVVLTLALPGLALAAIWLPFAIPARVRRLFELGPTSRWYANYVAGFVLVGAVHTAGLFAALTNAPSDDAVAGIVMFANPGFALALWAGAAFGLPFAGYDWLEDRVVTRVFLFLGAVWYAAVTTVPLFVLMVLYYMPEAPTEWFTWFDETTSKCRAPGARSFDDVRVFPSCVE